VALEGALPRLAKAGARVAEVALDGEFARLAEAQIKLSSYKFYRVLTSPITAHVSQE